MVPVDGYYAMSAVTLLLRRRKLTVSTLLLSVVTLLLFYTIPNLNNNKETLQNHHQVNRVTHSIIIIIRKSIPRIFLLLFFDIISNTIGGTFTSLHHFRPLSVEWATRLDSQTLSRGQSIYICSSTQLERRHRSRVFIITHYALVNYATGLSETFFFLFSECSTVQLMK